MSPNKKAVQPKWIKRAKVMETLRGRIVEGVYPQGMKLVEQQLAKEFSMSRPLIREILADLESQSLVEKKPNRGATVRRVDSDSLIEIMEIREMLEGLAARLAARKSKPSDWADLKKSFGEPAEKIIKNHEFEKFLELVAALRERMVKASQNEELSKLIYSLFAKITIVQRRVVILPGRMEQAITEHRQVIDALIAGDEDKAEKAKRKNLETAKKYLEKYKSWVL